MTPCVRGCLSWQRHQAPCRAEDRAGGFWTALVVHDVGPDGERVQLPAEEVRELAFDADNHLVRPSWREGVHVGRYGQLEVWQECSGCKPRPASHGVLCGSCHGRLRDRIAGRNSVAWAFGELSGDLAPGQGVGQKVSGSTSPAPPINLGVMDLQREILTVVGGWLWELADRFGLAGPGWWRLRVETASRSSWAPQNAQELGSALGYLVAWMERVEQDPELVVRVYAESAAVLKRAGRVAPWRARPRRLAGARCPSCEREAITVVAGSDRASCERCDASFDRRRFESSDEIMAGHERSAS